MRTASGGQRLVRRYPLTTRTLYFATAVFWVWLGFAAVDKGLDDDAVATLAAASGGLLLLRIRDAQSMPLMGYVSGWRETAEDLSAAPVPHNYRRVILANEGPGVGVITKVTWRVAGQRLSLTEAATMDGLRGLLNRLDLKEGTDYAIANYSAGAPFAPGHVRTYFECTATTAAKFALFEAVFEFVSLQGDCYERVVSLLPRDGAAQLQAVADAATP